MAANKFATMVHRNTNKFTLILVYALLEWVLIVLLLLNSLFSYLIIKFADYFGLKRPCLWCSRLDHFFEPAKFRDSYRSLVCEAHAMDISKLGYCSNHRKLAESQDMCEDCSSSARGEMPKKFVFFPWMKKLGVVQDFGGDEVSDNAVVISKCSCCGVSLDTNSFYPDNFLIKPFFGDSENTQNRNLILGDEIDDYFNEADHFDRKRSGFVCDRCGEKQGVDENRGDEVRNKEERTEENFSSFVSSFDCDEMMAHDSNKDDIVMEKTEESIKKDDTNPSRDQELRVEAGCSRDVSSEIPPQHLEFYIDQDDCLLIPIELMDAKQISDRNKREEDKNFGDEDFVLEFDKHVGTQYELVMEERSNLEEKVPLLPILECEEENIIAELEAEGLNENENSSGMLADFELEQVVTAQPIQSPVSNGEDVQESPEIAGEEMESDNNQVSEEVVQMQMDEPEANISIGTEIPDHEPMENIQSEEVPPSCMCTGEDPSTSNANDHGFDGYGSKKAEEEEEEEVEFRSIRVEASEPVNEIEDKIPDTPTSVDGLHHLHKKLLLLERRESGTEESLDGSVISDIEAGDGVLTVEKLKSALRAERKALNALYAELEEERSASAVAANQTMAMINRLQEEKAAMQMEALQYQRMMEEQSEYDQEALQLLNELMVKREKERAELEKELELYRKKVEDYKAREKLMMLKRRKESSTRSATSSASCSNGEDSDGLSVDFNHKSKEENGFDTNHESSNYNTPVDAVVYLEDSLANFEEERLSILEQLKDLEEKLFTLSDEEQEQEDYLHQENGNAFNDHSRETNGIANGHYKEMNGKQHHHHQERKHMGAKAKRLLPLFDAIDAEDEDGMLNGNTEEADSVKLLKSISKLYEIDTRKLAIEEEVDNVYERLQALEADREFLKHCMTSLKKGDKGTQLLQEILHHLRDLRNVELRVRNMEN